MKRILVICMLIIGLLLVAGCMEGPTSEAAAIEDTIRGYVTTFNAEDFDKCLTYFTDYEDKEDALAFLSFIRSLSGPLELREIKDIVIVPVAAPGGSRTATATVIFTITGEESTDQIQLKEVDGHWKIIWEQEQEAANGEAAATPPPPSIPIEKRLPGTVDVAPELRGVAEVEHCLWFSEDGGLNFWYQVRNLGDQTLRLAIQWGVYNAEGELVGDGGLEWNIVIEPGRWMGRGARWTAEDVVTQAATHYKMTVQGDEFSAIEEITRDYLEAYNAQDFDTCLNYLPSSIDRQVVLDSLSWLRGYLGEVNFQWADLSVSDQTAYAILRVTALGNSDMDLTMHLKKENGVWKIVESKGSWLPTLTPTQGFMPGTVEIAPELQGVVQIKHCSWWEADGCLWYWWYIRNIGDQAVSVSIELQAYNVEGGVFELGGSGGPIEAGSYQGDCHGHGMEGLHTATHYKIIVKGM